MEHRYETFAETCNVLFPNIDESTLNRVQSGGTILVSFCKEQGVPFAFAISLYLKSDFEKYASHDVSITFDNDSIELYKLTVTANLFEVFSISIENVSKVIANVYEINIDLVLVCLTNIIRERFYLYDANFLKAELALLINEREVVDMLFDSKKRKNLLREKISLEKSCEIKMLYLLEVKDIAIKTRTEFLSRFPKYLNEFVEKTKAEVLEAIHNIILSGKTIDEAFYSIQADLLCLRAGIEREMKDEFNAGKLDQFLKRPYMDPEMEKRFHQELTSEIKSLLKYAHPDKWNTDSTDDELRNLIADNSRKLVKINDLSKLGPGTMSFMLISELQRWKKEFALLYPEASKDAFKNKKEGHSLEDEIKFWEYSEQYLSFELESILGNKELENMRIILQEPAMHNDYEQSLMNSIALLQSMIDQFTADPGLHGHWVAILDQARSIAGNPRLINELYGS
jgi:hypothetical protein